MTYISDLYKNTEKSSLNFFENNNINMSFIKCNEINFYFSVHWFFMELFPKLPLKNHPNAFEIFPFTEFFTYDEGNKIKNN